MGLMQLLPTVGKGLAKQMKIKHFRPTNCWWPINLAWAPASFRQMVDHFGGQVEYALAAFDAG